MSQPSEPLKVKQLTEPRWSEQMEFHPPSAREPPRTMQSLLANLLLWAHYPGQICGKFSHHKGWGSLLLPDRLCSRICKKKFTVFYTPAILSLFLTYYECLDKRRDTLVWASQGFMDHQQSHFLQISLYKTRSMHFLYKQMILTPSLWTFQSIST